MVKVGYMDVIFGFQENKFKRKIKRVENGGRENWTPVLENYKLIKK